MDESTKCNSDKYLAVEEEATAMHRFSENRKSLTAIEPNDKGVQPFIKAQTTMSVPTVHEDDCLAIVDDAIIAMLEDPQRQSRIERLMAKRSIERCVHDATSAVSSWPEWRTLLWLVKRE